MKKKILIVDDAETTRTMLKFTLEEKGYKTVEAKNGTEAISAALSELPDLILLDIMMPGMNGIEVTKRIRAEEKTKNIPIFIISAYEKMRESFAEEKGTRVEGFVGKPFQIEALLEKIKNVLKG